MTGIFFQTSLTTESSERRNAVASSDSIDYRRQARREQWQGIQDGMLCVYLRQVRGTAPASNHSLRVTLPPSNISASPRNARPAYLREI